MFTLKHLKTFQHVSIIIQIIFREVTCSLLNLLSKSYAHGLLGGPLRAGIPSTKRIDR